MKPHPRIRKTVKWGGLAVSAILAAAWVGSTWVRIEYFEFGSLSFMSKNGGFRLYRITAINGRWIDGWQWGVSDFSSVELLPYFYADPRAWIVFVPFWMPLIPAAAVTAWAWRLDTLARRRTSTGSCPACGYALAGLPAGSPCPECGRGAVSSANPVS